MKINIDSIKMLVEELSQMNRASLDEIEFYEGGEKLEISPEVISEFELMGLNNVDFITSGFYKKEKGE